MFYEEVSAPDILKYIDDQNFYKMGIEVRVKKSDSIKEVLQTIQEQMHVLEGEEFDLYEVCKDPQNDYVRVMSSMKAALGMVVGDKDVKAVETIEEANKSKEDFFSHQSTWMLVRGQENIDKY